MSLKRINIPPILLSATYTTNLLNPNVTSLTGPVGMTVNQPFLLITHLHFNNNDSSPRTVRIYKGASAGNVAGTEIFKDFSIAANSTYDYSCDMRLDAADFLVGGADSANKITLTVDAEIGISG